MIVACSEWSIKQILFNVVKPMRNIFFFWFGCGYVAPTRCFFGTEIDGFDDEQKNTSRTRETWQ